MDQANLQNFLRDSNFSELLNQNPGAMKQMEGFWKFLDNLAESNPDEYKKYIDEQMKDMKQEISKEKEEELKQQTITSQPGFCMKALISKRVEEKDRKTQKEKGVQLFDFGGDQTKESFADNEEKSEPLEEPKIYLNIVHSDQILPPLNKQREIADPKNDKEWLIIPVAFTPPQHRKSLDGLQCIHYDGHVNSCVIEKMRDSERTVRSITNYVIMKFQQLLEDQFILHKRTIKFLKNKKYKDYKGTNNQKVHPFVLPKELDVRAFKQVKEKLKKEQKEAQKLTPSPKDIKLFEKESDDKMKTLEQQIKIPGQQPVQEQPKKKPLIVEMITKTKPQYEAKDLGKQIQIVFNVEEELSAKEIDLDISETQLKLNSKQQVHLFNNMYVQL